MYCIECLQLKVLECFTRDTADVVTCSAGACLRCLGNSLRFGDGEPLGMDARTNAQIAYYLRPGNTKFSEELWLERKCTESKLSYVLRYSSWNHQPGGGGMPQINFIMVSSPSPSLSLPSPLSYCRRRRPGTTTSGIEAYGAFRDGVVGLQDSLACSVENSSPTQRQLSGGPLWPAVAVAHGRKLCPGTV